ncbi:MAG TPA: ATP-binding protein, partial [Longimicrobiales bacterium]
EEVRDTIDERAREGTMGLMAVQREIHQIRREAQARVEALHIDVTERLVRNRMDVIKARYEGIEPVERFLDDVRADIVKHVARFTGSPALDDRETGPAFATPEEDFFRRYQVNPMVCHKPGSGAPLVEESNPNVRNLLGRVEGQIRFGVMVTDFTRMARGAVHQANGGYLILDAEELLSRPLAWPSLKRVLRTHELRPADPAADIGIMVTESLEPQAIPADVKVVLIGRPRTYYMLQALDPDFPELFKVKVDFATDMDRTAEAERGYAAFVAGGSTREGLPAFDAPAVARVVEEASRLADDQKKLTTRFRGVVDLIREAAHRAGEAGREVVGLDDVDTAVRKRAYRESRPHREILDLLARGVLAFSPEGEGVGRLWGIGLLSLNDRAFGRPMSVTASAYAGGRGVINIERETSMSGPIHSKGVLLLQGYLGRMFARREPLVLSASMSFDQLYEEVEGDSASVAELYALMSAIGDVPLRQDLAVTGALNQQGQVLPVGGVTEKIEGFYDACLTVGMSGTQGVILPRRNVDNLVLRKDVRDAVEEGTFNVYAIDRVEEGWRLLAGMEAGEPDDEGDFPEDSVHGLVAEQLRLWREGWRSGGEDLDDLDVDDAAALVEGDDYDDDEETDIPGVPDIPEVDVPVGSDPGD